MNINLADKNLTKTEKEEIEKLLQRKNENITNELDQLIYLHDLIWDDYGCDNKKLNWDKIGLYYNHPVWILSGLFIEQDNTSMGHRHAISEWIFENNLKNIVDYGGGFGTLARLVAQKDKNINMNIYEPHPSELGLKRVAEFKNIYIIDKLDLNYDCLMSTDVLEHVPDPLKTFSEMVRSVKKNGYLVVANHFYPFGECHLPQTFHFRYSFNYFAIMMGLKTVGILKGSHATIFIKNKEIEPNWKKIRFYERLSKFIFPSLNILISSLRRLKRILIELKSR
jgi:2-polyprenyl-6-hydroxyphenyl methylase/3-demethylubiquinone-9 3-methyltransferase